MYSLAIAYIFCVASDIEIRIFSRNFLFDAKWMDELQFIVQTFSFRQWERSIEWASRLSI